MTEPAWIGGSTGSGKSTVAHLLASRHSLRLFRIDDFWYDHVARLVVPAISADDQWLGMTPAEQAAEWEAGARRTFPLVLDDLARLPDSPQVIVEGPTLLPDLLPRSARAVFLRSTPEFQRLILSQRGMPPTRDPETALANRIEKDRLFGERLGELAKAAGFPLIEVDGRRPPSAIADDVERLLGLAGGAHTPADELAAARRWQNEVFARNVRTWLASPDAHEGASEAQYGFVCECGAPGCDAVVELTAAEFDRRNSVLSCGHTHPA